MEKQPLYLETSRPSVTLRELATEADDVAYFAAVQADPNHLRQFGDTTADKYQTLAEVTAARLNAGDKVRMGIWDEGTFVGTVNLRPDSKGGAELGYWTHPDYVGRGYATLGAQALAAYGAEHFETVYAKVVEGNDASTHVLESAGFIESSHDDGEILFTLGRIAVSRNA